MHYSIFQYSLEQFFVALLFARLELCSEWAPIWPCPLPLPRLHRVEFGAWLEDESKCFLLLLSFTWKKMKNILWWGWIYPFVCDLVAYRRISLHHSPTQSNRSSSTQLCVHFATYLPIFYYQNYSTTLSFSFVLWQASIDTDTQTHTRPDLDEGRTRACYAHGPCTTIHKHFIVFFLHQFGWKFMCVCVCMHVWCKKRLKDEAQIMKKFMFAT